MPTWQIALVGLVAAWSLQGFGTYLQVRHYGAAMGEITGTWTDGFVGTGVAHSTLGAGLMLLLVVDSERVVRRLLVMRGRSVFARFAPLAEVEGLSLDALRAEPPFPQAAHRGALATAIAQIEKAAAKARPEAASQARATAA